MLVEACIEDGNFRAPSPRKLVAIPVHLMSNGPYLQSFIVGEAIGS